MEEATEAEAFSARSWLFAPGDSERKMEKAAAGPADIVILDLEDAVAVEEKPRARTIITDFLKARADGRERLWVRVNPLDGAHTLADLAAIMPARPGGIMLPKARGRADVELLDHYLSALEVANGIEQGSTRVIVLVTETAAAMFTTGSATWPMMITSSRMAGCGKGLERGVNATTKRFCSKNETLIAPMKDEVFIFLSGW